MKTLIFLVLLSGISICFGQEFGEVTDEELQMSAFPEDPEADAVILFDIGNIEITSSFQLEITRHVRIKILTEEGKKHADIVVSFWGEDHLYDLEAACYTTDGEEYELDDDAVFEQEEDDWKFYRFSLPGVQIGSVIEYEYQAIKEPEQLLFLKPWYFQNEIFTKLSQLTVTLKPGFQYNAFHENLTLYDFETSEEEFLDIDARGQKNKRFTWRVKNIPLPVKDAS